MSFLNIGKIFSSKKRQAYTSLKTIPIGVWWEITEDGDYKKLIIEGKYTDYELFSIYLDLLQQHHDEFGSSETHNEFIKARYNYALKLAKWVETQSSFDEMLLQMAEIDLKEASPKVDQDEERHNLSEEMAAIEHEFGQIDEMKLSALKFYSWRRHLTNQVQKQQQSIKSWQKR